MKIFNFAYSTQNITIADDEYDDYSDEESYCFMNYISDNLKLLSAHQINVPELYNQALDKKFYNCKFFRYSNMSFAGIVEDESGSEYLALLRITEAIDGDKSMAQLSFIVVTQPF